jgi:hypothetical protein
MEHAAAITGLYVALHRLAPSLGWEVLRFEREVEGREEFQTGERPAAVVPDVSLVLRAGDAEYHAMVEIDLGTMSLPRVAKKLGLYCAWARSEVWKAKHPYLPVLLFLTSSPRRVEKTLTRFEEKCRWEARRADRFSDTDRLQSFVIGVCDRARAPEAALIDAAWFGRDGADGLRMADLLARPWQAWRDHVRAERERTDAARAYVEDLAADPERQRAMLQEHFVDSSYWTAADEYRRHYDVTSDNQREALRMLIESTDPMTSVERAAYGFFLRRTRIDDARPRATGESERVALSEEERRAIRRLVAVYERRQQSKIAGLWSRYPGLPVLVRAMRTHEEGKLVPGWSRHRDEWLREDLATLRRMEGRLRDYLAWRDTEARRRRERLGNRSKARDILRQSATSGRRRTVALVHVVRNPRCSIRTVPRQSRVGDERPCLRVLRPRRKPRQPR